MASRILVCFLSWYRHLLNYNIAHHNGRCLLKEWKNRQPMVTVLSLFRHNAVSFTEKQRNNRRIIHCFPRCKRADIVYGCLACPVQTVLVLCSAAYSAVIWRAKLYLNGNGSRSETHSTQWPVRQLICITHPVTTKGRYGPVDMGRSHGVTVCLQTWRKRYKSGTLQELPGRNWRAGAERLKSGCLEDSATIWCT